MKSKSELKKVLYTSHKTRTNSFYEIMLICLILWVIIVLSGIIPFWGIAISFVFMSILSIGQKRIILNAVRDEKFFVEQLFLYFKNYIKIICLKLSVLVSIVVWSLCFIIPGIICGLNNVFVSYVFADNPNLSVEECMEKSKQLAHGKRLTILTIILSMILLFCIVASSVFSIVLLIDYFVPLIIWLKWTISIVFTIALSFVFIIPYYEIEFASLYCICSDSCKKPTNQKMIKSTSINK